MHIGSHSCYIRAHGPGSKYFALGSWDLIDFYPQIAYSVDPAGMVNSTHAAIIPATGAYKVTVHTRYDDFKTGSSDTTGLCIYVNGTVSPDTEAYHAIDLGGRRCVNIMAIIPLTAGDAVRFYAFSNVSVGNAIGWRSLVFSVERLT